MAAAEELLCGAPYLEELPGCRSAGVSAEEVAHFKSAGFLVKVRTVPSRDLSQPSGQAEGRGPNQPRRLPALANYI